MTPYQKDMLKLIGELNEKYLHEYKFDMLILLDHFLNDILTIESFEYLCNRKGLDIMDEYDRLKSQIEQEDDYDID